MPRILITGAAGFVGHNLVRCFSRDAEVIGTDCRAADSVDSSSVRHVLLDIRDGPAVANLLMREKPDAVIHAAGNKNVKDCQLRPREAHEVNAGGTLHIAQACRRIGAKLIYLSTDLVFDSYKGGYLERDLPQPSLAYGASKLEGERLAAETLDTVAIFRSGGIYGPGSPLLGWLRTELQAGRKVSCFTDVYNTPTYVDNLADMIRAVIRKSLCGRFHTIGCQRVNRFEFFRAFCIRFGLPIELLDPSAGGDQRDRMLLRPDSSLRGDWTAGQLGIAGDSVDQSMARFAESGGV